MGMPVLLSNLGAATDDQELAPIFDSTDARDGYVRLDCTPLSGQRHRSQVQSAPSLDPFGGLRVAGQRGSRC
jgi:hypothetical protein